MINNISRLPDAYAKEELSNLYAILELAYGISSESQADFEDISDSRDIEQAYGKTLDNYGETFGVLRSGADDAHYRMKIKSRIANNSVGSDCNSVINAVATLFNTDSSKISITESEDSVAVGVNGLTMSMLQATGYTSEEAYQAIKSIIPIGVRLIEPSFAGTLMLFDFTPPPDAGSNPSTRIYASYPQLFTAWLYGQQAYADGNEVGLSGAGTVPNEFLTYAPEYSASGTYEGGTLGILTGE